MTTKISIIGAGSGAFSLSMIRDICLTPNLAGSTVSLMDIDPDRLDVAHSVCQRYAQELGFELMLEKTLDRRHSLRDAEFVINTALVAGHQRLREGWAIAQRYGFNWGGSFHVMYDEPFWINFYQLRLFESIIEDMLEICPEAYLLLVANPVLAGITYLTRMYPMARLVGLCHGFGDVYRVAETLGLGREGLTFEIPGVNHFVWCTRLYHNGRDVFPILDRWIAEEAPRLRNEGKRAGSLPPKTVDLYQRFGAIPIGDTAHWSGASWPLWYHSDEATERRWMEEPATGWNGYFTHVEKNAADFKYIARSDRDPVVKVTEYFPPRVSGEPMIPIVESISCDIPRVIIGNIQNRGDFVPGIPRDFEVEIPTLVSKRGIQGIQTGGLPPALLAHALRDRVAPVNLELEAYRRGSKELLTQLIMMDPWARSVGQVQAFVDEVLALPYHGELREHYR
jgi:alpha-galactosidase